MKSSQWMTMQCTYRWEQRTNCSFCKMWKCVKKSVDVLDLRDFFMHFSPTSGLKKLWSRCMIYCSRIERYWPTQGSSTISNSYRKPVVFFALLQIKFLFFRCLGSEFDSPFLDKCNVKRVTLTSYMARLYQVKVRKIEGASIVMLQKAKCRMVTRSAYQNRNRGGGGGGVSHLHMGQIVDYFFHSRNLRGG